MRDNEQPPAESAPAEGALKAEPNGDGGPVHMDPQFLGFQRAVVPGKQYPRPLQTCFVGVPMARACAPK